MTEVLNDKLWIEECDVCMVFILVKRNPREVERHERGYWKKSKRSHGQDQRKWQGLPEESLGETWSGKTRHRHAR